MLAELQEVKRTAIEQLRIERLELEFSRRAAEAQAREQMQAPAPLPPSQPPPQPPQPPQQPIFQPAVTAATAAPTSVAPPPPPFLPPQPPSQQQPPPLFNSAAEEAVAANDISRRGGTPPSPPQFPPVVASEDSPVIAAVTPAAATSEPSGKKRRKKKKGDDEAPQQQQQGILWEDDEGSEPAWSHQDAQARAAIVAKGEWQAEVNRRAREEREKEEFEQQPDPGFSSRKQFATKEQIARDEAAKREAEEGHRKATEAAAIAEKQDQDERTSPAFPVTAIQQSAISDEPPPPPSPPPGEKQGILEEGKAKQKAMDRAAEEREREIERQEDEQEAAEDKRRKERARALRYVQAQEEAEEEQRKKDQFKTVKQTASALKEYGEGEQAKAKEVRSARVDEGRETGDALKQEILQRREAEEEAKAKKEKEEKENARLEKVERAWHEKEEEKEGKENSRLEKVEKDWRKKEVVKKYNAKYTTGATTVGGRMDVDEKTGEQTAGGEEEWQTRTERLTGPIIAKAKNWLKQKAMEGMEWADTKAREGISAAPGAAFRGATGRSTLAARGARKAVDTGIGMMRGSAGPAGEMLVEAFNKATSASSRFVEAINPSQMLVFNLAMRDLNATIGMALQPVMQAATTVVRDFANTLLPLMNQLRPVVQSLANSFTQVAGTAINAFATTVKTLMPVFEAIGQVVQALVPLVQTGMALFTGMVAGITSAFQSLLGVVGIDMSSGLKDLGSTFREFGKGLILIMAQLAMWAQNLVGGKFATKMIEGMQGAFGQGVEKKDTTGLAVAQNAQIGAAESWMSAVTRSALLATQPGGGMTRDEEEKKWREEVKQLLEDIKTGSGSVQTSIMEKVGDGVMDLVKGTVNVPQKMWKWAGEKTGLPLDWIPEWK